VNPRRDRARVRYRSRVWLRVARRASVSFRCHSTPPPPTTPACACIAALEPRPGNGVAASASRDTAPPATGCSKRSAPTAPRRPGNVTATTTSLDAHRRTVTPPARVDRLATDRPAGERRRRDNPIAVRGLRGDRRRPVAQLARDPDPLGAWAMASRDRAPTRRPDHPAPVGGLHARLSP